MSFEHLLSPIRIGPRTIRNRMLITGHMPGLDEHGAPGPREIAYQRERAFGGAGLQITGATPVHASSLNEEAASHFNVDDRIIPAYRNLADAVHAEGGTILAQLAHYGGAMVSHEAGRPIWAPSSASLCTTPWPSSSAFASSCASISSWTPCSAGPW